jgi:1-acyl-sn-glycerol-3-phosphate acyltransferase
MLDILLMPFRFAIRLVLLLLHAVVGLPVALIFSNRFGRSVESGGRTLEDIMLVWWARMLCRIFGLRTRRSGEVASAPVLLLANHISWLDIMALYGVTTIGFVSKAEVRHWPFIGFIARLGGVIFHQRGCHDSASGAVLAMIESLKAGRIVAIFPEGGILPGNSVKRFHARLLKAAVDVGCPVQPVMVRYVRKGRRDDGMTFLRGENFVTNTLRLLARPGCTVELVFCDILETSGRPRRELAELAQASVQQAYESKVEQS